MKPDIHLAIFDLTGTTIEDRGEIEEAFSGALHAFGLELDPDRFSSVRGKSKREALAEILPPGDPRLDRIYAAFLSGLQERYSSSGARLVPGARETLRFLRREGVVLALTTGLDRSVAELLRQQLDPEHQVRALVCGDEVSRGRPAPYLIFRAMERTEVQSVHRVLAAGDTEPDLLAGFHAGVRYNVGVLTGAHRRERLERAPHTHLLPSIAAIPHLWS